METNVSSINGIINAISKLTVLESVALTKELQKVFGIDLLAQIGTSSQVSTQEIILEKSAQVEVEEKTSFDLHLLEFPQDKKIAVLKVVRNATGLGLKESKDIVDSAPKLVKEGLTKEQAESIKKEFEVLGAKIEIK